jgi:hypothetical protein
MAVKNTINAVELYFIASSVMDDDYQSINSQGLPYPCFLIRIINDTDENVTVSYDGVTDNDFIIAGDTLQLSLQTNNQPSNNVALMAKGTIVYVKGTAGTGDVYLAAYYSVPASV